MLLEHVQMDLRLVEYVLYLAAGVALTLWAGRSLQRGLQLVGLGGVALLLLVGGSPASAADAVRTITTRLGLVLLVLGGLHLLTQLFPRPGARPAEPAERAPGRPAEYEPLRPTGGRFPY